MRTALKQCYITAKMVAEHWNDENYPGPNKDGKWDGDAVTRKLRRLLERADAAAGKNGKGQDRLSELFLSKWRGGKKGEWVFFDTSVMTKLAIDIREAADPLVEGGLTKTRKLLKEWHKYYDEYGMRDYEPKNTYDTLKWIFDLLDANKTAFFTSAENDELKQRLCNLLPWFRDVDEITEFAQKGDKNGWLKRLELFSKNQSEINYAFNQYYLETRNDIFFTRRLFDRRKSVRDTQYNALALWKNRWLYVINQILTVRSEEEKYDADNLPVKEIAKCAVIWHLKEGNELEVLETYDKEKNYLQQCKELIFDICGHKLKCKYKKDFEYVIWESFLELENIHEFLKEESDKQEQEKEESAYLEAVHACIDIISPPKEGRVQMDGSYLLNNSPAE